MNETFGKEYKLCSQKQIKDVFTNGNKLFQFPFGLHYAVTAKKEGIKYSTKKAVFQVTISVPKRNFKKAHDRNRIKRLIREAIRKNKLILEEPLLNNNQELALFLIYKHNKELDFESINQRTQSIFNLLNQKTHETQK